jgi:hypothetical protein
MAQSQIFNFEHLHPNSQINRVKIIDLPGCELDETVRDKTAIQLLSAQAVADLIREHLPFLPLTGTPSDDLRRWEAAFSSSDEFFRQKAVAVAVEVGRRLGIMLAVLKRGDASNREARDEWQPEEWAFWSEIKEVWLGGGLVSGQAAPYIKEAAETLLEKAGVFDLSLYLSVFPGFLPLLGVARRIPPTHEAALVFDFGQTSLKRALAFYRNGALTRLELLPTLPSATFLDFGRGGALYRLTLKTLGDSWREVSGRGLDLNPKIGLSIAAYTLDGHLYKRSDLQDYNFRGEIAGELSQELHQKIELDLIHDGTAAALVHAGRNQAAVIVLGTSLGIGLPPVPDRLCPIASGFKILPSG